MRRLIALCLVAWLLATASSVVVADEMPPLYLETFMPYVGNYTLPTFPPCNCDPHIPYCVC